MPILLQQHNWEFSAGVNKNLIFTLPRTPFAQVS
jgi:hypothetical protein